MTNKLLVLGNGFDLHLKIKSSFEDFLNSEIVKKKSSISGDEKDTFKIYNQLSDLAIQNNKRDFSKTINLLAESYFKFSTSIPYGKPIIDPNNNVWAEYFSKLSLFPDFVDDEEEFNIDTSSNFKKTNLKNWSDIEYQLQYILESSVDTLKKFRKLCESDDLHGYAENGKKPEDIQQPLKQAIDEFENSFDKNGYITYESVLNLTLLTSALDTGWDKKKENIYDFLFEELLEFEKMFKEYLNTQINNDYSSKAKRLAQSITGTDSYSVLNFNYTTFYDDDDSTKTNIHSTLSENNHPIFGISSIGLNATMSYDKPYYKFTKTYRIMSSIEKNKDKNTLPDDINEVIFYGHSLSSVDYLYLETIFNNYYRSSKENIVFKFKYSNFTDKNGVFHNVEQEQVSSIYKLFSKLLSNDKYNSSFQKLLLNQRIKIEELSD